MIDPSRRFRTLQRGDRAVARGHAAPLVCAVDAVGMPLSGKVTAWWYAAQRRQAQERLQIGGISEGVGAWRSQRKRGAGAIHTLLAAEQQHCKGELSRRAPRQACEYRVSPGDFGPDAVPTCVRACVRIRQDGLIHKEELIQALFNNESHSLFSEQVEQPAALPPRSRVRLAMLAHPNSNPYPDS